MTSDSESEIVSELAKEYLRERRAGRRPQLSQLIERHPDLADAIRDAVSMMELMEDVAKDSNSAPEKQLERLGEYRIHRVIGKGGMGTVYEATQESLGRRVALKVCPMQGSDRQRERFRRESRSAAMLHFTNIVPVFAVGEADGYLYYAMQFIRGATLADVISELEQIWQTSPAAKTRLSEEGIASASMASRVALAISHTGSTDDLPLDPGTSTTEIARLSLPGQNESSNQRQAKYWESVARIGVQVAEALAYAHGKETLHRDIKPGNLMLDQSGVVWLMDFGLAKSAEEEDLTRDGELIGTLRYMAPEQVACKPTASSDVYSLGLTLYEMLTLRPAFDELSRSALLRAVSNREPIAPRRINTHIPRDLETIVLKSMEREQSRRYGSAQALAEDLERYLAGEPIEARRVTPTERLRKWARRRPLVAGLTSALAMVFLIALTLVTWQWRAAVVARGEAEAQASEAQLQKALAEASLDQALQAEYRSGISRAGAIARTSPQEAVSLLDRLAPEEDATDHRSWEWGYLAELAQQSEFIFPNCGAEQAEWIRSLAFSADETLLAVGAGRTGFTLPRMKSPRGRVTLWNLRRGQLVQEFPIDDSAYALAISDDKERLVICEAKALSFAEIGWGGPTWIWDIASNQRSIQLEMPEFTLGGRDESRTIMRTKDLQFFDRDQSLIGTIWSDYPYPAGTAIWDTRDGSVVWFRERSELISLNKSGNQFSIASYEKGDFHIERLELDSRDSLERLGGILGRQVQPHVGFSVGMELPNAKNRPYLHEVKSGQKTLLWGDDKYKSAGGQVDRPIHSVHPSGDTIAIGGSDGTVRLWQTQTGELQRILYGHGIDVQALEFSPTGRWLASGDWNGEVRVWQPNRYAEYVTCEPLGQSPTGCHIEEIAFRFDGSGLVSCGYIFDSGLYGDLNRNGHLTSYEPHSGIRLQDFLTPALKLRNRERTVKFSHDGQSLAMIGRDGSLRVQRIGDQRVTFESQSIERDIKQVAISDNVIATSRGPDKDTGAEEQVVIQSLVTAEPVESFSASRTGALALSRDGRQLAFAYSNTGEEWTNRLRHCDLETGEIVELPLPTQDNGNDSNISAIEFSNDGARLAVAWENQLLGLYDFRESNNATDPVFRSAPLGTTDFAWHPSGMRVAGVNREVCTLWNAAGETLLELRGRPRSADLPFDAAVAFSPDGTMLAATQWDNTIRIWKSSSLSLEESQRHGLLLPDTLPPVVARIPREAHSFQAMSRAIDAEPDNPWFLAVRGQVGSRIRDAAETQSDYFAAKQMLAGEEPCLFLHGDAYIEAPQLPLHDFREHTFEAWIKHWNYQQPGQVYGVIACQYPRVPRDYFRRQAYASSPAYDKLGLYWLRPTVYRDVKSQWSHVAVCFRNDGRQYFLNGNKIAQSAKVIPFPEEMTSFFVGATPLHDPQVKGQGLIRSLRVSKVIRYEDDDAFVPDQQLTPDQDTVLQFDFTEDDGFAGATPTLIRDRSGNGNDGKLKHAWWITE
ncbi:MAG: WD40 repeat domain-containing serine/threonine protein kinase [Planctomycetota bacterium]